MSNTSVRNQVTLSPRVLAALSSLAVGASAMAGAIFHPSLPPEGSQRLAERLAELELEMLMSGDRFTAPGDPGPQLDCQQVGNRTGGRQIASPIDRREGDPTDRDHEIWWSYLPDGTSIEASPATSLSIDLEIVLAGINGQTDLPITMQNGFPESVTDDFQSNLFTGLSGTPAPFGFADQGGQETWQTIVDDAFIKWSEISGIEFEFVGGTSVSTTPNPDSGNAWDLSAYGVPNFTDIGQGDIRIAMTELDGASQPDGSTGNILAYVYPVGYLPSLDPEDPPGSTDPTQVTCNWGYQGNIILDKTERWTDPATPNLFEIVITRAVGQALGVFPACAANVSAPPFALMHEQRVNMGQEPLPQLLFTELQEDDIRAIQDLYGDPLEANDTFNDARSIPFSASAGLAGFTYAPHLMLPPGEFEVPIPLSISNDLSANIRGPSDNDQNDIDRFRIAIPVSESAAFNMSVIVEPVGTAIDQRGYQLSVSGRNGLGPIVGNCSGLSSIDDPLIKQDLRIRIHSFDVFSGDFNEVLFENSTGPGEPEIVTDFSVPSGVFYVSIEGDGGELQLYNLTLTIQRPLIESGQDLEPILETVGVAAFDDIGSFGNNAAYASIDGERVAGGHNAFENRTVRSIGWPGLGAAVDTASAHATGVAGLAAGAAIPGESFRGAAPEASIYSASIATEVFADGSFAVGKTALYFALFGMADRTLSRQLGFPEPATVINSSWSGGGRSLNGEDSISQAYDAAVSMLGVTIVSAAGNTGLADPACTQSTTFTDLDPGARFLGSRSIVPPATALNGISVGALGTSDGVNFDIVANFSSRGPIDASPLLNNGLDISDVRGGIDIVAPGTGLTNIPPDFTPEGGAPLPRCDYIGPQSVSFLRTPSIAEGDDPDNPLDPNFFNPAQGTSLASSIVAGAVALLQDTGRDNGLSIHPAVMKSVLMTGAVKLAGWTNGPGNAPGEPQDNREGLDPTTNVVFINGATQPLDVAQGAGRLDLKRSLEIYLTGYDPLDPNGSNFPGPTIDPEETNPNVPTIRVPQSLIPGTGSFASNASSESFVSPKSASLTFGAEKEIPLSPIDIAHRLQRAGGNDRHLFHGRSLQLGKTGQDLKDRRGVSGQPVGGQILVPFIVPSLGRGGDNGDNGSGGDNGDNPDPGTPGLPGADEIGSVPRVIEKIFVDPIGWDFANLDQTNVNQGGGNLVPAGFIDYVISVPLLSDRQDPNDPNNTLAPDQLTVTLAWLREVTISGIDFSSSTDPRLGAITAIEFEDLDLFVFAADPTGEPISTVPVASSISVWNTVEHVSFPIPQNGTYVIRVSWTGTNVDLFTNRPIAETPYALSWRVDFSPRPSLNAFGFDDISIVLTHWGSSIGDRGANYNLDADINGDGRVDFADLTTILTRWGQARN